MTLENTEGFIWMDGKFIPWMEAAMHPMSQTIHYGIGVFEGLRAFPTSKGVAIFRLQDHTDRLFKSAFLMQMKIPYTKEELMQFQCEVIRHNRLSSAYIRPLVYHGAETLGLHGSHLTGHVMIAAWDMGSYFETDPEKGLRMQTAIFTRNATTSVMSKSKTTGNYVNSLLAYNAAKSAGFDDALMLDAQGHVSEATTSNIFMIKNGTLFTPTTFSILEGITRATVFELAAELDYEVIEKDLTRDDIYSADEVFVTGTAVEIAGVAEIDGRIIGLGKRGTITKILAEKYQNATRGLDANHAHWLTYIN